MGTLIAKDFVEGRALQRVEQGVAYDWQPDRAGEDVEPGERQADQSGPQTTACTLVAVAQTEEN